VRVDDPKKQKNFLDFFSARSLILFGVGKTATAGGITCSNCVHTENTTSLEPSLIEHESYTPGADPVLAEEPEATEELIS
jgi:hypothetical protein